MDKKNGAGHGEAAGLKEIKIAGEGKGGNM
jgi:hypothetical protein